MSETRITLADRFELVDLVGVGTAASVFRAHDREHDAPVAVKLLHTSMARSPDVVARFRVEGDLLAGFDHPNIPRLHGRGVHDGLPWHATDFAPGRSLADRVLAGAGVGLADLLAVTIDVLAALAYVHRLGVVHRDIKPENVLFGPQGRGWLTDFGIARTAVGRGTRQGHQLGTPAFCPPEQMLDPTAVSEQTDLYAVGVTLFTSATRQSGMALAVHTLRPKALALLPQGLATVVDRATAIEPHDRHRSADHLARELSALRLELAPSEVP